MAAIGGYPLIAQLLYNRGIRTEEEAQRFLQPVVNPGDPLLLPEADVAVKRLIQAATAGERVGIFGDFDADGVTASAVLTQALRSLGIPLMTYIPDRVSEGHGLNLNAVHHLKSAGVSLIITADCGISSVAEVAAASELGMDVVITDHHVPPDRLPDAVARVNPKLKGADPAYADLASVGVAARLMDALFIALGKEPDASLLEYVALGTVADLAPMHGAANRSMVRQGMRLLNSTTRPGLVELMKVARIQPGGLDTEGIAYGLGPRINAPGRVDHANASYHLLVARTQEEAAPLALELDARNSERQKLTKDILARVMEGLETPLLPILVFASPDFPAGVIGLAAGKLTEEFHRPSIVCEMGLEETRGSCRSIPEFNIVEALRKCEDLFIRYGGHAQAAGFSMLTKNFPRLKQRLEDIAGAALPKESLSPRLVIDADLSLDRVNGDVIRGLALFEPLGQQNPTPVFLSRNVEVRESRAIGAEGQHTRLKLRAKNIVWDAVAFRTQVDARLLGMADIVYSVKVDRWGGQSTLKVQVLDMMPSA